MKKLLLLVVFVMLAASQAFPQTGSIGVFADPAGASCGLNNSAGFMQVHVVHGNTPGATGCQFSLVVRGSPLTYIGQTSAYNTIGTAPAGVAVAYGSCLVSPIDVLTVTYMGTSAACDRLEVQGDPAAIPPGIYMTDCSSPIPALHQLPNCSYSYINNNGSCPCT